MTSDEMATLEAVREAEAAREQRFLAALAGGDDAPGCDVIPMHRETARRVGGFTVPACNTATYCALWEVDAGAGLIPPGLSRVGETSDGRTLYAGPESAHGALAGVVVSASFGTPGRT